METISSKLIPYISSHPEVDFKRWRQIYKRVDRSDVSNMLNIFRTFLEKNHLKSIYYNFEQGCIRGSFHDRDNAAMINAKLLAKCVHLMKSFQ